MGITGPLCAISNVSLGATEFLLGSIFLERTVEHCCCLSDTCSLHKAHRRPVLCLVPKLKLDSKVPAETLSKGIKMRKVFQSEFHSEKPISSEHICSLSGYYRPSLTLSHSN